MAGYETSPVLEHGNRLTARLENSPSQRHGGGGQILN
jgi:hypothetical protein